MQNGIFPWSDNWWLEGDRAWFCGGAFAALFCVNMNSLECEIVQQIPECDFNNFRQFSYCLRYENNLFCLPTYGKCVWCYDNDRKIWEKIGIPSEEQILICMASYGKNNSQIILRDDEGKFIEIDLEKKEVGAVYRIPLEDSMVGGYVLVGNIIYGIAGNKVYCINRNNSEVITYEIGAAKAGFYTIAFDGKNFWISGFCKEIYVWNPKQGVIKVITEFPEQFGIYRIDESGNFFKDCNLFISLTPNVYKSNIAFGRFVEEYGFFSDSVSCGKYMWFTPHRSDGIIYVDKDTYEVYFMEIEEEEETEVSIKSNLIYSKYLIEYIREDRYIGLFSIKKQWIFEIDAEDLRVRKRNYKLNDQSVLSIAENSGCYNSQWKYREGIKMENMIYTAMLRESNKKGKKACQNIGQKIYEILNKV